jgi:hypothetical protein
MPCANYRLAPIILGSVGLQVIIRRDGSICQSATWKKDAQRNTTTFLSLGKFTNPVSSVTRDLDSECFLAAGIPVGITSHHVKSWWEGLDHVAFHEVVYPLMSDHGLVGTVGELPV